MAMFGNGAQILIKIVIKVHPKMKNLGLLKKINIYMYYGVVLGLLILETVVALLEFGISTM